ncbi:MAG: dihydrolipoyl dehydrogenase [Thermoanaerobacteraceae bacterium]|nr:dihydrolipoyl dehydrogenase [Thermoanaerobacteraceae bacterium]
MKLIVIGGGYAGYVAAIKAAMLGAEVTLIEKGNIGGNCINVGSISSKALLAPLEIMENVFTADKFGVKIEGEIKLDFNYMVSRKDSILKQLVSRIEYILKIRGVKIIRGTAKLLSNKTVEVIMKDGSKKILEADKIIIATGSVPVVPPMFPYDGKHVITSDEVLSLKKVPESLVIVGGGPIGCEIGQFFSKLGTDVKIIEKHDCLISSFEDEELANELQSVLKRDKVQLILGDSIKSVEVKDGKVYTNLESGKKLESELMLLSVGRKVYIDGLRLEELGVAIERGKIVVNDKLETNIEGILAVGDVINTLALANVALMEGIVAAENAFNKDKRMNYKAVPRCIFTSPEIAAVGVTEKQLKEKNIKYKVGRFNFAEQAKAEIQGKTQGFVKVIADMDDKIIGASIFGAHATDLLAELTLAVHLCLTCQELGNVIYSHPTLSEAIMEALHDVNNESVHSIK